MSLLTCANAAAAGTSRSWPTRLRYARSDRPRTGEDGWEPSEVAHRGLTLTFMADEGRDIRIGIRP